MSDMQKAAAAPPGTETTQEVSLLDQIVQEGRLARDPAARERGKNLVKEFVTQVLEGAMTVSKDAEAMINARIAQIDHLVSHPAQRSAAPSGLSEAGGNLARAQVPDGPERDQRQAEDQDPQLHQERLAARSAARARVRPERDVQEGLRRRVRHLRRRALRAR